MIADVIFLNTPYAYSSRQIPIGDLSEYEMHTVSNVKCSEDLVQSIAVPSFDDYSKANMVMINDEYYWVSGYRTKTYQEEVVIFDIVYNAVSSHLLPDTTVTGMFERVPLNLDKRMNFTIKDDTLIKSRSVVLATDNIQSGVAGPVYTIQIVSSYNIVTKESGGVYRYITFSGDPYKVALVTQNIWVKCNGDAPGVDNLYVTPTVDKIISNLTESTGIPADSIIDISISVRCPFAFGKDTRDVGGIYLVDNSGFEHPIYAVDLEKWAPYNYNGMGIKYAIFMIDPRIKIWTPVKPGYGVKKTLSIILTDMEMHLGVISIVDEGGNILATIPKELAVDNVIEVEYQTISDFTGLYTYIYYAGNVMKLPEGKLPWVGSSWADYQIRSMSSDRAELNLSINSARDQRNIELVEGAANAVMTGVVAGVMTGGIGAIAGVAQFAGSAISAEAKGRLGERVAREEMNIRHGRVKDSAPSSFNTMYGLIYIDNRDLMGGACIRLDMPGDTTRIEYETYVNNWGYPCTGVKSFNITEGYIKGMLTETIVPGLKGDLLNEELMKGVRISNVIGTIVPDEMFDGDLLLTSYPHKITEVGNRSFRGCANLENIDLSDCISLGREAFMGCGKLTGVLNLPNMTSIGYASLQGTSYHTVDITKTCVISGRAFKLCPNLNKLILRSSLIRCSLFDVEAMSTPIANGTGYIYVPDALVSAYKVATNWITYASQIKGLSELP